MTKAERYYTMVLHFCPNTALPIWNNKQTYSAFPGSTPELNRQHLCCYCTDGEKEKGKGV